MQTFPELIRTLTPKEQEAVAQFISYLRRQPSTAPKMSITQASDEFMKEHPELLRMLAK